MCVRSINGSWIRHSKLKLSLDNTYQSLFVETRIGISRASRRTSKFKAGDKKTNSWTDSGGIPSIFTGRNSKIKEDGVILNLIIDGSCVLQENVYGYPAHHWGGISFMAFDECNSLSYLEIYMISLVEALHQSL